MRSKKGQSTIITHTILVAFSIFLVLAVVNTFVTLRDDFQDFTAKNEIDQLCLILRNGVEKVIPFYGYRSPTGGTYASLDINLPDKLAGLNYRAAFENRTITIETLGTRFNTTCNVGFNVTYKGFSAGGVTLLKYTYNGTDVVEMGGA